MTNLKMMMVAMAAVVGLSSVAAADPHASVVVNSVVTTQAMVKTPCQNASLYMNRQQGSQWSGRRCEAGETPASTRTAKAAPVAPATTRIATATTPASK